MSLKVFMVWSDTSISECPGCGGTTVVGIMSLATTCKFCGFYYVDTTDGERGWYNSRAAFERGEERIAS